MTEPPLSSEPATPPTGAPPATDAGTTSAGAPARRPEKDPLRGSKASGVWFGVVAAAILLLLLVVFIVQNTQKVEVSYFGWDGTAPLAVALLVAAAAGMLIAILAASVRMLQVRHRIRKGRR